MIQPHLLIESGANKAGSIHNSRDIYSPSQFRDTRANFLLTINRETECLKQSKPMECNSHFEEAQSILNEMKLQRQAKLRLSNDGPIKNADITPPGAVARTR